MIVLLLFVVGTNYKKFLEQFFSTMQQAHCKEIVKLQSLFQKNGYSKSFINNATAKFNGALSR